MAFKPRLDTLYISECRDLYGSIRSRHLEEIYIHPCIQQLQFFAIEHHYIKVSNLKRNIELIRVILEHMPSLQKLTIVGSDPCYSGRSTKYEYRGITTFNSVEENGKDLFATYRLKHVKQFLKNFKFFVDHSEITKNSIHVEYKRIYRGGAKMLRLGL
ncbi:hypothetical protein N431DRAFT_445084 [Stipitochalara longipes BDJ]|nr:hypothetical protein N431DRAFT_445084 [Stipitochalara longipes BDJ]